MIWLIVGIGICVRRSRIRRGYPDSVRPGVYYPGWLVFVDYRRWGGRGGSGENDGERRPLLG